MFLNGELEEELCIDHPEGFPLKEEKDRFGDWIKHCMV